MDQGWLCQDLVGSAGAQGEQQGEICGSGRLLVVFTWVDEGVAAQLRLSLRQGIAKYIGERS